jgi:hypothetical protein
MWEFDVQPLQEYFAARYLYDTAPYSPAGRERSGTKPDIFDGIAPNSYWLNVTRFFAGCFSKGELLDLSDRVASLVSADWSYSRTLGIALLQDWVFTQSTRATEVVLRSVFNELGLRWASILASEGRAGDARVVLSRARDAQQLIDLAINTVAYEPRTQGNISICQLVRAQAQPDHARNTWLAILNKRSEAQKVEWIEVGGWLGVVERMSAVEISRLLDSVAEDERLHAGAVIIGSGGDVSRVPDRLVRAALARTLDWDILTVPAQVPPASLTWLSQVDLWKSLAIGLTASDDYRYALNETLLQFRRYEEAASKVDSDLYRDASHIAHAIVSGFQTAEPLAIARLKVWSDIVEMHQTLFGRTTFVNELAVIAGIFKAGRGSSDARNLFDESQPLTERVRYAKSQLNRETWWMSQARLVRDKYDAHLFVLTMYAWASRDVLVLLIPEVVELLSGMPPEIKETIIGACHSANSFSARARSDISASPDIISLTDPFTITLLLPRLSDGTACSLVLNTLESGASTPNMGYALIRIADWGLRNAKISVDESVRLMKRGYLLGADARRKPRATRNIPKGLSIEWARLVLDDPLSVSSAGLMIAQALAEEARPNPEAVQRIAERESWFGADT